MITVSCVKYVEVENIDAACSIREKSDLIRVMLKAGKREGVAKMNLY